MRHRPYVPFLALGALFASAMMASAQTYPMLDVRDSSVAASVEPMDLSLGSHDNWVVDSAAATDSLDLSLRLHDAWAVS